jgi:hypothetical protein
MKLQTSDSAVEKRNRPKKVVGMGETPVRGAECGIGEGV